MRRLLFTGGAILAVAMSAWSQQTEQLWDSGNAFLQRCRAAEKATSDMTSSELVSVNNCISYVNGLDEGIKLEITFLNESGRPQVLPYCVPVGVKRGQPFLVLLKYIRENPATAHESTAILFGRAMKDAFPCQAQH